MTSLRYFWNERMTSECNIQISRVNGWPVGTHMDIHHMLYSHATSQESLAASSAGSGVLMQLEKERLTAA